MQQGESMESINGAKDFAVGREHSIARSRASPWPELPHYALAASNHSHLRAPGQNRSSVELCDDCGKHAGQVGRACRLPPALARTLRGNRTDFSTSPNVFHSTSHGIRRAVSHRRVGGKKS
jgi:hypothetical protein